MVMSRHGPHRKHPVSNSNYVVVCVFVAAGTCLLSRCLETVVVYSHRLATSVYTTLYNILTLKHQH
jgi:hypothetical protein